MLKFTKMHGIGNDYVFIYRDVDPPDSVLKNLAIKLSNRNFGIGSDGLILISKSRVADFKMRIFNSDGSEGKMCGNGIRCVGKYVYENKLTRLSEITIETRGGIKKLSLSFGHEKEQVTDIRVNMGKVKLTDVCEFKAEDITFKLNLVNCGNPHAVIFVEKDTMKYAKKYGESISTSSLFPDGVNVEFVRIIDNKNIEVAVYERGSGITLACGTGACASYFISYKMGLVKKCGEVSLPGGKLKFSVKENDCVYMQGGAAKTFEGTFYD